MLKELTSLSGYDFGSSLEQGSSHEKLHALRQTMAEVPGESQIPHIILRP